MFSIVRTMRYMLTCRFSDEVLHSAGQQIMRNLQCDPQPEVLTLKLAVLPEFRLRF